MQNRDYGSFQPTRRYTIEKKGKVLSLAEQAFQRSARRGYRIELEKDVLTLRKKLRQEVDTRKALERAFRRTLGVLPRFSPGLTLKVRELLAEVAVLEEEVISLEECIVALRQELYSEAVQLSASKLPREPIVHSESPTVGCQSPQIRRLQGEGTSDRDPLIAKLLPPVVVRKIEERSSNSKTRTISDEKLHSSEKLRMQKPTPFTAKHGTSRVLDLHEEAFTPRGTSACHRKSMSKQCRNLEKENQLTMPNKEDNIRIQRISTPLESKKFDQLSKVSSVRFNQMKESVEPNLLSEEMVWCLSNVFLRLTRQCCQMDCETASILSHSTATSIWSFTSRNTASYNPSTNVTEEMELADPYRICGGFASPDVGPYQYYQEITTGSLDYSKIPRLAALLKKLMCLVEKLRAVDLRGLTHQQKLAFWINMYNACIMHGFLEHGIPNDPNQVVALMSKAVVNVGGHVLSALAIEHFILRLPCNSAEGEWKDRIQETEKWMHCNFGLEWPEPLVSFALCCGSWSSPALRIYTPLGIEHELEVAKEEYLQAAVGITSSRICMPKMLDWYMRDFAKDVESLMDWISEQLPAALGRSMRRCLSKRPGKEQGDLVQVMPYDFTFRYIFAVQTQY